MKSFSDSFSIGVEATLQQLHGSHFGFSSLGAMMAIDSERLSNALAQLCPDRSKDDQ
jgi:hypothetical protein